MKYSGAMKAFLASVSLFFAALSLSAPCAADVIYSNLGPGATEGGGQVVIGSAAAAILGTPGAQNGTLLFESSANADATSFTVGVYFPTSGYDFNPLFDAFIYSNIQSVVSDGEGHYFTINQTGAEIAEIGESLQAPSSPGLVTFSPPAPVSLTSGSLYWAILTPNNPLSFLGWDSNSLEVDGTLLTPEPATFGLLACALAGLITIQKTRIAAKQR